MSRPWFRPHVGERFSTIRRRWPVAIPSVALLAFFRWQMVREGCPVTVADVLCTAALSPVLLWFAGHTLDHSIPTWGKAAWAFLSVYMAALIVWVPSVLLACR